MSDGTAIMILGFSISLVAASVVRLWMLVGQYNKHLDQLCKLLDAVNEELRKPHAR